MKTPGYDYDKYTYRIIWSEEDKAHLGYCLEFPSLIVHGKTTFSTLRKIEHVVKETLKWMVENKEPVPELCSHKNFF